MSEGLNKVQLIGNLGADPEFRTTQGGQSVLTLRVATTERYGTKAGKGERTEWHTVIIWGNRAEALSKILRKGDRAYYEGRLQTREWEKDGQKRYKTEIVCDNVLLLGSGRSSSDGDGYTKTRREPQTRMDDPTVGGEREAFDDDQSIPF